MSAFVGSLIQGVIGGLITGAFFWGALRVELRWLRRDVDYNARRIDEILQGE